MRIDLHSHSTASDGTEPPDEVVRRAGLAGLDVLALTDHDTLAGHVAARRALPPGLDLVTGMELSCRLDGRSVHMLAYGLGRAEGSELAAECAAIVAARLGRARRMVERLRELGVGITWPQVEALAGGVVGRPHVARAMVAAGAIDRPEQAFTPEWIGAGGRAYVSRYALDPVQAIGLIADAGGAAVLAHPGAVSRGWKIPGETISRLAGAGLAGLEVWHPDHDQDERSRLGALATSLDLVPTGGSDDHGSLTGHRLGQETCPPESYERLMARCGRLAGPR
ncbi:MAG TPA: PHP domain-containing protein [Streptosporangiaceae bacterium]|nr:PHP domain-containing protein [Streptosporangiaceae bacterium]